MSDPRLPTGVITFLLTDVEGSTRLWEAHPERMGAVIETHNALIAAAVSKHNGVLIRSKGEGDSTFSVFSKADDAVVAALELQRSLEREPWPEEVRIRVRAALYTGEAELRDDDYFGTGPNRCARIRAVVHGGQTVCSEYTAQLVTGHLPRDLTLRDLGLHRLRDLARAERLFQLCHPDLADEFPPLLSLGVRHNLPAQRSSFIGRDMDLIFVQKHLETHRLVTLTGVGGCGKTRLAIEAASEQLEAFPDGVFFVDLSPVTDPHVVAGAVAASVGFSGLALGTGSGRPAYELLEFLSARQVLLVIDNCEHLLDACAHLVDEILERCPRVSILATSRQALELQGEQTYPVAPMDVPDDELAETSDAVRLFHDRALSVLPDFVMPASVVADVAEICKRLDGIPLAIELAAAQTPHLSPRQIVERLNDRFGLLSGGGRRAERQQTLHAALDWSHELLTDTERVVLRRLAVFPGTFSHQAADAVCGNGSVFGSLRSLVGKSLVVTQEERGERRFRLLETVRVYADEKLNEAGEDVLIRDRHRDHFLAWVESIPSEQMYLDPDGSIRHERHNLRAALKWSESQGRNDLVGRIASTMNRIWIADIREGRRWLTIGMESIDDLDHEHRVRVLAVAAHVAVLAIQARDGEIARRAVEASEGRPGLWSSLAHSLLCLNTGIRFFMSKNPSYKEEVEKLGRLALELAPGPPARSLAWFWFGQARVLTEDPDKAMEALEKGAVEGPIGPDVSMACLAMLAVMLHMQGRHEEAMTAATKVRLSATSIETGGLWAWALYCSLPYALELGHLGRDAEAVDFIRDLLEEGMPRTPGVMTSVIVVLAALAVMRGDEETAGVLLEYGGRALLEEGIRTPVDIALYTHYLRQVRTTTSHRQRAADMSLAEVIALGLETRGVQT